MLSRTTVALFLFWTLRPGCPQEGEYRISTDVNLVVLSAAVLDPKGGFVSGLERDHFKVFEDGRLQPISVFRHEDVPVTVGLVVDGSGSMQPKRRETISAAIAFVEASNPEDEVFVVNFNEDVALGLPKDFLFTNDVKRLRTALYKSPVAGQTALYDAIALGLEHLERGTRDRKALVVFSDGGDNASECDFGKVAKMAAQSSATIYTIGLFDEQDRDRNPGVLKRLAKTTGGESYLPKSIDEVSDICRQIAHDIRNQYTIGYVPPEASGGSYHHIRVTAAAPGRGKLLVRTKTGYISPSRDNRSPGS